MKENEDGLFGFVQLNLVVTLTSKQLRSLLMKLRVDAPVPFNVPIEFDGEPEYGEHDITVTVRYKDGVRDEIFVHYDTTIFVEEPSNDEESGS